MQSNRFELTGYLAGPCQQRVLPSGTPVANGRLGQTYQYRTTGGTDKHTNWFNLTFYGELSALASTFQKGDNLHIIGTIQQRQFTPKDGSTRSVYEVVVQRCHRIARMGAIPAAADPSTERSLQEQPSDSVASGGSEDEDAWAVL
jgi:single-stranded DNA-binding protein